MESTSDGIRPYRRVGVHLARLARYSLPEPWSHCRTVRSSTRITKETVLARISIHGFGRIGRSLMRVALKNDLFVPVSISDIRDVSTLAALFEVDSNYGRWHEDVAALEGSHGRPRR
jgi:hypothetical protein